MTEIRNFVGIFSNYCIFVKNFSSIAMYFTSLNQKEVSFIWSSQCEEIFQYLKTLLTTAPILSLSVKSKDFIVLCHTLLFGLGGVLMWDKNVIAYALR